MAQSGNKVVVTGGAGFIGSHLCEALRAQYRQVIAFDNLTNGKVGNIPDGVQLVRGDVRNLNQLTEVLAGADCVFHLAAIASVEQCRTEFAATHAVNLNGLVNIIEVLRQARSPARLVFASSAAVYGDPESLPIKECSPGKPISSYGLDKLSGEGYCALAARTFGIPSVALRFFNVVGPRQDPRSPYSGVVSIFADRMLRKQPVTIFGDGLQTRDFVSVRDVVARLTDADTYLALGKPTPVVCNVCTGQAISVLELFNILKAKTGYDMEPVFAAAAAGDIRFSVGDPTRADRSFGLRKFQTFEEMLDDLLVSLEPA